MQSLAEKVQISLIVMNKRSPKQNMGNVPPPAQKSGGEAAFTVALIKGLYCHILQFGWINRGILRVSRAQKRKGSDTAVHFSFALTLASTERWMNWLKGAICN